MNRERRGRTCGSSARMTSSRSAGPMSKRLTTVPYGVLSGGTTGAGTSVAGSPAGPCPACCVSRLVITSWNQAISCPMTLAFAAATFIGTSLPCDVERLRHPAVRDRGERPRDVIQERVERLALHAKTPAGLQTIEPALALQERLAQGGDRRVLDDRSTSRGPPPGACRTTPARGRVISISRSMATASGTPHSTLLRHSSGSGASVRPSTRYCSRCTARETASARTRFPPVGASSSTSRRREQVRQERPDEHQAGIGDMNRLTSGLGLAPRPC